LSERTQIKPDDVVLIQGCGTIGLLAGMVAKTLGAHKVIITGTNVDKKYRLPVARKLEFDKVINVSETDLKEEIMSLTKGFGVDIVVEASGSEEAINSAVDLVKKKGTILAIGEASNPKISFHWNKAIFSACSVLFTLGANYRSWEMALKLLSSKSFNAKELISHKLPLEKWEEGFHLLDSKEGLKVLLIPNINN